MTERPKPSHEPAENIAERECLSRCRTDLPTKIECILRSDWPRLFGLTADSKRNLISLLSRPPAGGPS